MPGRAAALSARWLPHVPENWNPKKAMQLDALRMAEKLLGRCGRRAAEFDPGYARTAGCNLWPKGRSACRTPLEAQDPRVCGRALHNGACYVSRRAGLACGSAFGFEVMNTLTAACTAPAPGGLVRYWQRRG